MTEANRTEDHDLYYLQVKGSYSGNSLVWWRSGRHGYTSDIQQAHVFTRAEAFGQAKVRPDLDIPWRKAYIDARLQHHVNCETVGRNDQGAT